MLLSKVIYISLHFYSGERETRVSFKHEVEELKKCFLVKCTPITFVLFTASKNVDSVQFINC